MLHRLAATDCCRPSRLAMVALAVVAILASAPQAFARDSHARPKEIAIQITETGFVPASVQIRPGRSVVLVMTRITDQTCATEAVFPKLGTRVELPLNEPVRVKLAAQKRGRIDFACGMGMYRGVVVVR